jgi:hypothetical protein
MRYLHATFAVLVCCATGFAEDFHVEFTGSYWALDPSGYIQTRLTRVDLRSDLGISGTTGEAFLKAVVKPGARHRINFEVIPYRLSGENVINRTIEFGGRTYPVQDTITSETNIDYVFGGYQFDIINNRSGHLGIGGGVAYFDGQASATSVSAGVTASERRQAPLPMVGGEFRVFVIPDKDIVNINGEAKGLPLGTYGSYFQATGNAGVALARFVRVQAGFAYVHGDVHNSRQTDGFKLRFAGPVFSVQLHD